MEVEEEAIKCIDCYRCREVTSISAGKGIHQTSHLRSYQLSNSLIKVVATNLLKSGRLAVGLVAGKL